MHDHMKRSFAVLLLAALALGMTACGPASSPSPNATPTITPVPTTSVEPTASAPDTSSAPAASSATAVSSGPITTPASGSSTRTAILKVASTGLGVSGNITVYQLFVQGTAAVGDIQLATGKRTFFALVGGPGSWKLVWSATFGSTLAKASDLHAYAPEVSPELIAKLDWKKAVAKKTTTYAAPTAASFRSFVLKSAASVAGGSYTGTFTVTAKIAKDSSGSWWGNALADPSQSGLESIGVWGHYVNGKWTGEIADFSTDGADASFFPASVLGKLQL
jgi:hypothetical protein